jgi:LPXTG-motif cell wall-anchored protein
MGDWDGDGHLEVAVVRRDGTLFVWHTAGTEASWSAWGCDPGHTGSCTGAIEDVEPPTPSTTSTTATSTTVATTLPPPTEGGDELASDVDADVDARTGSLPSTGRDIWLLVAIGLAVTALGALLSRARRARR